MALKFPPNKTFNVQRNGTTVLTGLPAFCAPMREEIVGLQDVPASKPFEIFFTDPVDVREQDVLVSQADATDSFRVRGIKKYLTRYAPYTYATADGMWGSE